MSTGDPCWTGHELESTARGVNAADRGLLKRYDSKWWNRMSPGRQGRVSVSASTCPARPSLAPPTPVTPDVGSGRAPEPRQDAADRPKRPTVPTEQAVSQIEAIERAYPPVVRNPTGHPRYQYRTGGKPDASTRFDGHFDCPASGTSTRSIAVGFHLDARCMDRPILGYVLLLGFPSARASSRSKCRAGRPRPKDPAGGFSGGYRFSSEARYGKNHRSDSPATVRARTARGRTDRGRRTCRRPGA